MVVEEKPFCGRACQKKAQPSSSFYATHVETGEKIAQATFDAYIKEHLHEDSYLWPHDYNPGYLKYTGKRARDEEDAELPQEKKARPANALEQDRDTIRKFVFSKMDGTYDLQRFRDQERKDLIFADENHFRRWNTKCIEEVSVEVLASLKTLIPLIEKESMGVMDKEDCVVFPMSGFCWDLTGKLVFFNER